MGGLAGAGPSPLISDLSSPKKKTTVLRGLVPTERERHLAGACFRVLAWSLYAVALIVMGTAMGGMLPKNDYLPFVAPACLFAGFLSDRYAKRLVAEDAYSVLAKHPREFVLLLRCFSIDDYRAFGEAGLLPNLEETLVHTLSYIGPVIAVGRPQEHLPPLGAARLYIRSEDWQAEVKRLMQQARAVVLVLFTRHLLDRTHEAQGFRWEIQQALSQVDPQKVMLVLPAATKLLSQVFWFGRRKKILAMQSSFDAFAEPIQNVMPYSINEQSEGAQFLCFDSRRQLMPLRARRLKKGHAGFVDALQPFFRALGLSPPTTNVIILELRFNRILRLTVLAVSCGVIGFWLS